jgi:hypothetical protein
LSDSDFIPSYLTSNILAMLGGGSIEDGNVIFAHSAYIGAFTDDKSGHCAPIGDDPSSPGFRGILCTFSFDCFGDF